MALRYWFLCACLVAVGIVAFRDARRRNRETLERLFTRERALLGQVRTLRLRQRALRRESEALHTDRYYVERVARAEIGWRRTGGSDAPFPNRLPPLAPPATLVLGLPSLAPNLPPAAIPDLPKPPSGKQCLAWLGYDTVVHFQRKMMPGRRSGQLDGATAARARRLMALLRRLGFDSVEAFQKRHGLTPDGIFGRRSERCLLQEIRSRHGADGGFLADSGHPTESGG